MKSLLKSLEEDALSAVHNAIFNSGKYFAADAYQNTLIDVFTDKGKVFIRLSDSVEYEVEARIELREIERDIKANPDIDPEDVDAIASEMIRIGRAFKRHAIKIGHTP